MREIGNYYVTDTQLGTGGMGTVYQAVRRFDGMGDQLPCACKVIRTDLLHRADRVDYQRMLQNEALLSIDLSHEHLVQVFDCVHEDGTTYLFMEYIDGMSLDELLLRHGSLPESTVVSVIYSAAKALDYLHRRQILHRDVAPPNILISNTGEVKVTDLGLARTVGDSGLSGVIGGRIAFSCPASIRTKRYTTHSDLWALLVTAFDAASGILPFGPDDQAPENDLARLDSVVQRAMFQEISIPEHPFTSEFYELVEDLGQRRVSKREFQTAAEIVSYIECNFEHVDTPVQLAQLVRSSAGLGPRKQGERAASRRQRLPLSDTGIRIERAQADDAGIRVGFGRMLRIVTLIAIAVTLAPDQLPSQAHATFDVEVSASMSSHDSSSHLSTETMAEHAVCYITRTKDIVAYSEPSSVTVASTWGDDGPLRQTTQKAKLRPKPANGSRVPTNSWALLPMP